VILALEEQPPAGKDAVSWLLLTTLPITGFEDVVQYLRWLYLADCHDCNLLQAPSSLVG
jgi:hypothetical protein